MFDEIFSLKRNHGSHNPTRGELTAIGLFNEMLLYSDLGSLILCISYTVVLTQKVIYLLAMAIESTDEIWESTLVWTGVFTYSASIAMTAFL